MKSEPYYVKKKKLQYETTNQSPYLSRLLFLADFLFLLNLWIQSASHSFLEWKWFFTCVIEICPEGRSFFNESLVKNNKLLKQTTTNNTVSCATHCVVQLKFVFPIPLKIPFLFYNNLEKKRKESKSKFVWYRQLKTGAYNRKNSSKEQWTKSKMLKKLIYVKNKCVLLAEPMESRI